MSFAQNGWLARGRIQMPQKDTSKCIGPPKPPLAGAVALVTGGNRGIGRAIALRLAGLGAGVAICGRNAHALAAAEAELKKSGSPIHSQIADVSQSADVTALVDKTASRTWARSPSSSTMPASVSSDRRTKNPKTTGTAFSTQISRASSSSHAPSLRR